MKNRKMTYLLLPVVIVIWGIIGYKLIVHFDQDTENITQNRDDQATDQSDTKQDTFRLIKNYRDPFLGKENLQRDKNGSVAEPIIATDNVNNATEPVIWPVLTYHGIILNKISGGKTTLVRIEGHEQLLSEGQKTGDIRLIKAFADSAVFQFHTAFKTIKK